MSMIWRSAMPLLTTLAALVIIVHCIEEDLDTEYQHHILTRLFDGDPQSTEESRKLLQETPIMLKPREIANGYDNTSDDVPKRRRRKHKRRPQTGANFEIQDRFSYPGDPLRPLHDVNYVDKTSEPPKRRRKKPADRPIRWVDDEVMVAERPIRQKVGTRRKRPPVLSEFGHSVINEPDEDNIKRHSLEDIEEIYPHRRQYKDQVDNIPSIRKYYNDDKSLSEFSLEVETNIRATKPSAAGFKVFDGENINGPINTKFHTEHDKTQEKKMLPYSKIRKKITKKSFRANKRKKYSENLSLTSNEMKSNEEAADKATVDKNSYAKYRLKIKGIDRKHSKNKVPQKPAIVCHVYGAISGTHNTELSPGTYSTFERLILENYHMDPLTLKEILKKSNGTSLSEILQQHNLSLSDLLNGNVHAVSILKSQEAEENKKRQDEQSKKMINEHVFSINDDDEEQDIIEGNKFVTEVIIEYTTEQDVLDRDYLEFETTTIKSVLPNLNKPKVTTSRRYPIGLRKKLRMRPVLNVTTTRKMQLSKDFMALNGRKYINNRNRTKSQEWKSVLGNLRGNNMHNESTTELHEEITTETILPDQTIPTEIESNNTSYELRPEIEETKFEDVKESTPATDILTEIPTDTDKAASNTKLMRRPNAAAVSTRQKAFDNKLTRKRIKQKSQTTETPDNFNLLGNGNLVSSSEFIMQTQNSNIPSDYDDQLNTLDDVITTESTTDSEGPLHVKIITGHSTPDPTLRNSTAKKEIEEILTDTRIREKLAIILKERNMTLSELVDHRERGSSHVHLADIFHNASKEPNPPEPFLSKSLLEPISKETYPLRAILEANLHDPTTKLPIDRNNVPVIMDYRNNVNENGENIGIMSLFHNFINASRSDLRPQFEKKSEQILNIDPNETNNTVRESRKLNKEDYENWKELISLMKKENNESEELHLQKKGVNDDVDGDGLILLEDLQNLYLENNMDLPPLDSTEIYTLDDEDPLKDKSILDKIPSQTRSVTIATASIAGLAMILFLLTYAAYKWKQSYMVCKTRNFCDQRIPTPVFENRKSHKHNSSGRSISPMLQTSNIYTLDKLESQNGKDIPDYMWDTLRKPFQ